MKLSIANTDYAVYISPKGYQNELIEELSAKHITVLADRGRLFLGEGPPQSLCWAQNVWLEPRFIVVSSISDAVRKLKSIQRNWAVHPTCQYRRTALIDGQLPSVSRRPLCFGMQMPDGKLGAWTLWENNLLLASPECSSQFADGEVAFVENKNDPPGRAYLKLWEAFTLLGQQPEAGQVCLDLGSAPGSWTWVLAGLGAKVISVDKAPLAGNVAEMPNVEFRQASAFALSPEEVGRVDWFFCDVACYPSRLLQLLKKWLAAGKCAKFVCTVKLQGEPEPDSVRELAEIPGSRLMHLSHNKHELTWLKLE